MKVNFTYPPTQLYSIQLTQPLDIFDYGPLYRKSVVVDCKCPGLRDKKRPNKWVGPLSQRGKDKKGRIGWKKVPSFSNAQ